MRRVRLHIDTLVLHGVAYEDRRAVAAAIERELARSLAAPGAAGTLADLGHLDRLRAPRVDPISASPSHIGTAAGRGIARALAPREASR
jgi:hypothetical protein